MTGFMGSEPGDIDTPGGVAGGGKAAFVPPLILFDGRRVFHRIERTPARRCTEGRCASSWMIGLAFNNGTGGLSHD
jgi:hypothetical protein